MINKIRHLTKISSLGFILGASLCWTSFSIFRANWDGISPFILAEFWLSIILFLSATIIFCPYLAKENAKLEGLVSSNKLDGQSLTCSDIKKSKLKNSFIDYAFLSVFSLFGVLLVVLWHLQIMEGNIQKSTKQQMNSLSPTSLIISNITSNLPDDIYAIEDERCLLVRGFLSNSILNNNDWNMSVFDKLIIKDNFAKVHASGCINDKEMFDLVQKLRFRKTFQPDMPTASFGWSFYDEASEDYKNKLFEDKFLPITKESWCIQTSIVMLKQLGFSKDSKNIYVDNKISLFCSLQDNPDEVIIYPMKYEGLYEFNKILFEEYSR